MHPCLAEVPLWLAMEKMVSFLIPMSFNRVTKICNLTGVKRMDPEQKKSLERLNRFRIEWETFIDGMIKEWKTLNVISALLLR